MLGDQHVLDDKWWNRPWLPIALVLLCAVPLLWPSIPPLLDLPGHIGRYHIALNLASSPDMQRYFSYEWALIGNLGVDLLAVPLGSVLGVEAAAKVIIIAIPLMMGAGFLWAAAQVHGRVPPTALLALVFTYAYPFHYGFVNYCLGVATASVGFALWIRLHGSAFVIRALTFAAIAAMTWIAHAVGWVVLCVLCGSYELWWQWSRRAGWWPASRRTAVVVLPLLSPLILMSLAPRGAPLEFAGWLDPRSLAKWLLALNRDRWLIYDVLCTLGLTTVVGLAVMRRFGLSINPALGWPALALLVLYILAPDSINGSAFVGARIIPYATAYAILAIRAAPDNRPAYRAWAIFCTTFIILRIGATTASFLTYHNSYERNLRALNFVPRGSEVAVLARQNCHSTFANWGNPRLQHLGGLAIARREAFVNDQWDAEALQLLSVNYPAAQPFMVSPSEGVSLEPCGRDKPRYLPDALRLLPRDAFDYVWLLDIPAANRPQLPWLKQIYATPEGALYAVGKPAPSIAPTN
jgi:hypothetical protein